MVSFRSQLHYRLAVALLKPSPPTPHHHHHLPLPLPPPTLPHHQEASIPNSLILNATNYLMGYIGTYSLYISRDFRSVDISFIIDILQSRCCEPTLKINIRNLFWWTFTWKTSLFELNNYIYKSRSTVHLFFIFTTNPRHLF